MGDDFLSRTKPAITKHIDGKRVALATPDLFTLNPADQPRRSVASIDSNTAICSGERVILEAQGRSILLLKGNAVVGRFDNPAPEILKAISNSGGAAGGIVHRVLKLSRKAEVSLC